MWKNYVFIGLYEALLRHYFGARIRSAKFDRVIFRVVLEFVF